MSEEDYEKVTNLEKEIKDSLAEAFQTGDPGSDEAQRAAELHKKWLTFYWGNIARKLMLDWLKCMWMTSALKLIMMISKKGWQSF